MEIDEQTPKSEGTGLETESNEKKFIIKKWHAVTLWTWGLSELYLFDLIVRY
jgi:hypothetical protein